MLVGTEESVVNSVEFADTSCENAVGVLVGVGMSIAVKVVAEEDANCGKVEGV